VCASATALVCLRLTRRPAALASPSLPPSTEDSLHPDVNVEVQSRLARVSPAWFRLLDPRHGCIESGCRGPGWCRDPCALRGRVQEVVEQALAMADASLQDDTEDEAAGTMNPPRSSLQQVLSMQDCSSSSGMFFLPKPRICATLCMALTGSQASSASELLASCHAPLRSRGRASLGSSHVHVHLHCDRF
jgi:hypothetical protein